MKATLTLVLLLLVFDCTVAQESTKGCPVSEVVIIDGIADEWPMIWIHDDNKIFYYNVCADDNNLYVRVRTNDHYTKGKMASFGFTVWIDPNGKKKKKMGLRFPMGGREAEERAAAIREQGEPGNSVGERADNQKLFAKKLIENLEVMELIGLADDPITSTRSGITNGIKVAIALDIEDAYVYEALIPFKAFRLNVASISEVGVGFETGRFDVPKAKNNTKGGAMIDYTNPSQMSRMQGYGGMMGNPKLTYASYAWTTLKLK